MRIGHTLSETETKRNERLVIMLGLIVGIVGLIAVLWGFFVGVSQ
jgi:hypothetical protein